MNFYKLLFVDRKGLLQEVINKINWEKMGFSFAGYTDSYFKAIGLAYEYFPDVIMINAGMPCFDAMELSHEIKKKNPTVKIIIFNGINNNECDSEDIQDLKIDKYIMKPVNEEQLINIFGEIKESIDREKSDRQSIEALQEYHMKSLPLLQVYFYSALIEGRVSKEEITNYLEEYRISLTGSFYCCLVVHTSYSSRMPKDMNNFSVATLVQNQAEKRLGKKWIAKCFSYNGNVILVVQLNKENDILKLIDECNRFCRYINRMKGIVITVGVGRVCENLSELSTSYGEAREAVSYRSIYGTCKAISIKDITPGKTERRSPGGEIELSNLFRTICLNSEEDVEKAVDKYIRHIFSPKKSLQMHYIDIMDLTSNIYRFTINQDISIELLSNDIADQYSQLFDMDEADLKKWLVDIILSMKSKLTGLRSKSANSFVSRAKDYIYTNYSEEEVSLDGACKELGISNAYLSTIFKQITGSSFVEFLTDYRMKRAARLLLETNEKSYVIAKNVGYTDPNYFSYIFKKKYGISPSKYRAYHIEN